MKAYLYSLFAEASKKLDYLNDITIQFDKTKNESHGDLATNAAMMLTKKLRRNPREIAQEIIDNLEFEQSKIEKVEIAGPGFINFFFASSFTANIVERIIEAGDQFGRSKQFEGKSAIVEFVSANPTGPLTVGHGRNAVLGDTSANLLEAVGYKVDREYYFNNAGRQMRVLGDSVRMRYLELLGDDIDFPEEYYQGEYITDIAKSALEEKGDTLRDEPAEGFFKAKAEEEIFKDIQKTLGRISIVHSNFFNENTLYDDGKIDETVKKLRDMGLVYDKDGAVWFKLTEFGHEQDKVIIKSTGEPTYRLPDIAYHCTKFDRGYDSIVDLFGADHMATYPDVLAGVKALGYDPDKVHVLIHQFVTVIKDGQVVKMSTRKANYITLDELIDEVGPDVVRYFFNMRSSSSHMNFDLDLAKKQSDENPVFYMQYAHARICSIMRQTEKESLKLSTEHLELLTAPEEQRMLKKMNLFEEEVLNCAVALEPHRLAQYLEDLAASFHRFYTECRIIGSETNLAEARIALSEAARIIIRNGLAMLGVSAPERM